MDSYLSERIYYETTNSQVNEQKLGFYKKMLGEKTLKLLMENTSFQAHIRDCKYFCKISDNIVDKMFETNVENNVHELCYLYFQDFYQPLITIGLNLLKNKLETKKEYITVSVYSSFERYLAKDLQDICIRTLISEMHLYKNNGLLLGNNSDEEYNYFCKSVINNSKFLDYLWNKYPVLKRIVFKKIIQTIEYFHQIICWFKEDYRQIELKLLKSYDKVKICSIQSTEGDCHNHSQKVVKVILNTHEQLILKPRSSKAESVFYKFLNLISIQTGSKQFIYNFISYEDHSWCSFVEYISCTDIEEVKQYYIRIGEQLFLSYLLGIKDLHLENLISFGEYPVFVDLECFDTVNKSKKINEINGYILNNLSNSVLATGILPTYYWNKEGKGVICSALSDIPSQECPFELPLISCERSSNMRIEYSTAQIQNGNEGDRLIN